MVSKMYFAVKYLKNNKLHTKKSINSLAYKAYNGTDICICPIAEVKYYQSSNAAAYGFESMNHTYDTKIMLPFLL